MQAMQWDVYCRVIDNHGDVGVCWRLLCDLADRGHQGRLWIDDAQALQWMAPSGHAGVTVLPWPEAHQPVPVGDVLIEAFGCELPEGVLRSLAEAPRPPLWINLEYLSAEAYVERSHRLPSPQSTGPVQGLTKWFYYPGFTARTGGLLREPSLSEAQANFDRAVWLSQWEIPAPEPGELLVSLFCYRSAPTQGLLRALEGRKALVLLAGGATLEGALPSGTRTHRLPYLPQPDYDRLLWACDLNFVRGEDSFVRAQWAAKPFIWQAYEQEDGVHAEKLHAFLNLYLSHAPAELASALRHLWSGWNGLAPWQPSLPDFRPWHTVCEDWLAAQRQHPDLVTGLLKFALESR